MVDRKKVILRSNKNEATIYEGCCLDSLRHLPSASVHCCVTSPPYWGLRDYGREEQIGLEETPEAYVAKMVAVFREVRRVLREDGTLWLNLGDSYASSGIHGNGGNPGNSAQIRNTIYGCQGRAPTPHGLKAKDLVGIPWRVAFALQADGWFLRQDLIWAKPNAMPESVTDRCTKAHEYVFLLSKRSRYFFDAEAIKEESIDPESIQGRRKRHSQKDNATAFAPGGMSFESARSGFLKGKVNDEGRQYLQRNRRSVWSISTKPYSGAHFATMPVDLVEPCILAGTSAEGCCAKCGNPWIRILEKERTATRPGNASKFDEADDFIQYGGKTLRERHLVTSQTVGFEPSCECNAATVPCVVLDPFSGSGTTLAVAAKLERNGIGCELNSDYIRLAIERIGREVEQSRLF